MNQHRQQQVEEVISLSKLSDRIRAANPEAGRPLPDHLLVALDDIMAGRRVPMRTARHPKAPRRRWGPAGVGIGIAASFIVASVIVMVAVRPAPAVAATPPPLSINPTTSSVEQLREEANTTSTSPSSPRSSRGASWDGWFLQLDADQPASTYIQPQRTALSWNEDLSGWSHVVAGTPRMTDGTVTDPLPTGADVPGATLYEETWGPGEMVIPFRDAPPDQAADMKGYLDAFLDEQGLRNTSSPSAGEYLFAVTTLMQFWSLNDAAQRATIEVLLSAAGVEVAGVTTDRAGRAGTALDVEPTDLDSGYRILLVIDTENWRLLAVERITIEGIPDFGVRPGSVTDYTLWR